MDFAIYGAICSCPIWSKKYGAIYGDIFIHCLKSCLCSVSYWWKENSISRYLFAIIFLQRNQTSRRRMNKRARRQYAIVADWEEWFIFSNLPLWLNKNTRFIFLWLADTRADWSFGLFTWLWSYNSPAYPCS
jgi:hypothetical protein